MKHKLSKQIFSVILAFVMVVGLIPAAAIPVFAQNIIGLIYASGVRANEDVVLWGDTTLVMDQDLTVLSIQGDYNLTIEGSGRLTVNGSGNGIDVKSLSCTSDLYIQTGWHAIDVDGKLTIQNNYLYAVGGIYADDFVEIVCSDATIAGNDYAIYNGAGGVVLDGTFAIGAREYAIYTEGYLSLNGNVDCNSTDRGYYCIYAVHNIETAASVNLKVRGSKGVYSKQGNITLSGDSVDVEGADGVAIYANAGEITISAHTLAAICMHENEESITAGIRSSGNINLFVTGTAAIAGNCNGVFSHEGDVNLTGGYYFIGTDSTDVVVTDTIRAKGNVYMDGDFRLVTNSGETISAQGEVVVNGSLSSTSNEEWDESYHSDCNIYAPAGFNFYGTTLEVEGLGGIFSNGDISITADSVSIIVERYFALYGEYIYVDSDELWLENEGSEENENIVVDDATVFAQKDVTLYSESGGIVGEAGIYAGETLTLNGNFVVGGDPDQETPLINAHRMEATGNLTVRSSKDFAIKTSEDFSFNGTTLDVEGYGGIDAYGVLNITADNVSVLTQKLTCIEGHTVFIDCDVLRLENAPNENDPTVDQFGIACYESATVNCPDATIISCDHGIFGNGCDVTLNGNFTILGKGGFGKGIWASNLYLNGGQFTVASNTQQAIEAGWVEVRGNLSVSTKGKEKCLWAREFIFDGTTLAANGYAGIWGGVTQINADSVVITTDVGDALGGDEVYVTANYLWAENKATKVDSDWQELGGSQHGISAQSRISLMVKNGTVIGYEDGLHVYDDLDKFDIQYIHVDGSLTVVSQTGAGMYAPEGIIDLNGGPIVSVGETHGIDGNQVYFEGNGLRVEGNTGIHGVEVVDLNGDDIKITAEGERKSGIWCENGYVDLMGEVVIETNGWYGINADTHVSFDKGYYQISGPEDNAQAVKAGSFLYMDGTLEIVDPKYGHVNGNEIYGNGDSPAMELEMYSAIPEVSVYIDLPREGELPTRNASGIYFLDPRCTVEEIIWYEDGEELVSQDAAFRAGHRYTVKIIISADDPYRFLSGVMGKVNDKEVSTGLTEKKIMYLTADLGECPLAIRSVDLEIRSPEEGKTPSTGVTAASPTYGVYSRNVRWTVSTDGINYLPMAAGEKFVGGKYYRVFMDVTLAGNDYKFPTTTADGTLQPDVVSTVNGSPAVTEKAYDQDPQTVITVYFDFGKCNDYIIEEITIVDVAAPVAGQHPTYTANMFGTGYHIDTTKNSYYDAYWVGEKWYYVKNGISWWDVTDGGYDYVYENDVFLPGHQYQCEVYVRTDDGYEFVMDLYTNPETWPTATVNGNPATIQTEGSGLIWEQKVKYTFTCEENVVDRIVVDGITTPQKGQAPDYSPILGNTDLYTLDTDYGLNGSGIYWYDCEGRQLEAGEVFGDAGPYRMAIKFVPVYENGAPLCVFAYDVDVMINGKYVTPYGDWDDVVVGSGFAQAFYTFRSGTSAPEGEQTYTLSGSISVSGATVTLLRGDDVVNTLTAASSYSIENLAVGVYTLQVSKDGYETAEYSIVIATNTVQDVTLTAIVLTAKPGDVNGDGKVNNRDLGLLQQHLNSWDVTINADGADVNGDGKINNRDLGLLQQYLNGWDVTLK